LHGEAKQLLDVLKLEADAGLIVGADANLLTQGVFAAIGQHRVWDREPKAKGFRPEVIYCQEDAFASKPRSHRRCHR
jgi:hypothetical protein